MFIDLKASCFARGFFCLFINLFFIYQYIFICETFVITFVYIFVQIILLNVK